MKWISLILLSALLGCQSSVEQQKPRTKTSNTLEFGEEEPVEENAIQIRLGKGDRILFQSEEMPIDSLENAYQRICAANGPNHQVYLYLLPETKYEYYMQVQKVLEETTYAYRTQESQRVFEKPYDNLDAVQKQSIDALFPLRIIEKMKR